MVILKDFADASMWALSGMSPIVVVDGDDEPWVLEFRVMAGVVRAMQWGWDDDSRRNHWVEYGDATGLSYPLRVVTYGPGYFSEVLDLLRGDRP